jgi:hypothetical protein
MPVKHHDPPAAFLRQDGPAALPMRRRPDDARDVTIHVPWPPPKVARRISERDFDALFWRPPITD